MRQMTDVQKSEADAATYHCIEFLYIDDCPSHDRALELLNNVLAQEKIEARMHIYRIETEKEAEEVSFPGSPTIRIDGKDIDDSPNLPVGLACRAYRHDDGRISPLPQKEKIVKAIRAARKKPATQAQRELLPCG
jgi:hypothetical protein